MRKIHTKFMRKLFHDDLDDREPDKESFQQPQIINSTTIYFWDTINEKSATKLITQIEEVSKFSKIFKIYLNLDTYPPIHLHLNTPGGDVIPALAISDRISSSEVPIFTYCEGEVSSAGTLISVVGHKRFISKNSIILIHQLSGESWGTFEEIKDEFQNLSLLMNSIKHIYLTKTKMDGPFIDTILKQNLYMSSSEAFDRGLVDCVI